MNDSADKLPQQLDGVAPVKIDPALLKAHVARFVKEAYGGSPEKAVQVMKTIYGDDYSRLDLAGLEGRLQLITDLLSTLETSEKDPQLMEDVSNESSLEWISCPRRFSTI